MQQNATPFLTRAQKYIIFAISIGNMLECYDFYLYVFLADPLATLFFGQDNPRLQLFGIVSFFAIGFIFRILGGIYFGRLGDRIGRRKAFIGSMVMMAVSTFGMGLLPVYSQAGIWAPILLGVFRIAQTFPCGGEMPGAFCYLYEAGSRHKKFVSSFAGFSDQFGVALAALESFFLRKHFSVQTLLSWGWRLPFIIGGCIGLATIFLRYKFHETEEFQRMPHHGAPQVSLRKIFQNHWRKILEGGFFGGAQTVSFHFISVLFPIYFFRLSGMSDSQSLITTLILLGTTTIPLPLYGLLAEKYGVKPLGLIASCTMLGLLPFLYGSLLSPSPVKALLVMGLFAFCLACLTATWPYFLSHLFPTRIRYTCVGLSFNMSDGILGGISSLMALYFINPEKNLRTFIGMASVGCIMSIISCVMMKNPRN